MSLVGCAPCEGYDPVAVREAVERALASAGNLERLLPRGGSVLVKPNAIEPFPPWRAATTHPSVVEAVCRIAVEAGCRVAVGDCGGGPDPGTTDRALEASGIAAAARRAGASVVNLHRAPRSALAVPGCSPASVEVARPVLEADLVVSLPKLKTHALALMTGAVKNAFGCLPGTWKGDVHRANHSREGFSRSLAAIYGALGPGLSVMDAVVAMEGEGPCTGTPRRVGLVLAATDAVALDAVAARLIGYAPGAIPTTRLAASLGLGEGDLSRIAVKGADPEGFRVADFRKPVAMNLSGRDVVPELDAERCESCGRCVAACPVGAIELAPLPVRDEALCIHCLCCQELCPNGAVRASPARPAPAPRLDPGGPAWEEGGRRVPLSRVQGTRVPRAKAVLVEVEVEAGAGPLDAVLSALLAARPPLVVIDARFDPARARPGDARHLLGLYRSLREAGANLAIARPLARCALTHEDVLEARWLGVPRPKAPADEEGLHERCRSCVHRVRGRCPGVSGLP